MVPDYIRSSSAGSFGHYTIVNRFPRIVDDIIESNGLASIRHLKTVSDNISSLKIRKLATENANVALFNASIEPSLDEGIFDAPFFTAEMFFYQLLAHELDYHTNGFDYFSRLKQKSLTDAIRLITGKPDLFSENWDTITPDNIVQSLHFALWGNLADLSLFTLSASHDELSISQERILIDDAVAFINFFKSYTGTVHVFLDNAGYELVSDLYLIAILLRANPHCSIRAHVKPMPMFVSDTTLADWRFTLAAISDLKVTSISNWYSTLKLAIAGHRMSVTTDPFWSSAYHFSDRWLDLLAIKAGELIICKGDLNYRRFFEDRSWPVATPTEAAITTTVAPVLFLRTLKSEVMSGLDPSMIQQLNAHDSDWMISGKHGIVQFLRR